MKLVDPETVEKYEFIGGKISPRIVFEGLHSYAYAAVGPEIVKVYFDNAADAQIAENRLKEIGVNSIAEIKRDKNILTVWPKYLKGNPLETPERKYKIAYKLLSALSIIGELYYNDETGEIYIDEIVDADMVQKIVDTYKQRVYVVADEEREFVSLLAVDFVSRKPGE